VFHLIDGPRSGHPDVWSILHGHGKRVWNCSSMNARGFSYEGSAFLPDPWCTTEPAHPAELTAFQRFVAHHVQEHAKPGHGLELRDNAGLAAFMATHGLQLSTASRLRVRFARRSRRPATANGGVSRCSTNSSSMSSDITIAG
jgi:hypothetical protein